MARWSNNLTACINLCNLLIGLSILTFAITMMNAEPVSTCKKLLVPPSVKIGSVLVVVSLLGLLGSCCRSPFLLWIYLFFHIIIIFVMVIGIVLWIKIITTRVNLDVGEEYRFSSFASWFKDHVFGMTEWSHVRQCMIDRDLCSMDSSIKHRFYSIPELKYRCCTQPPWCLYDKNNASIPDCHSWTNEKDKMCYYCEACTGAFLHNLAEVWKRMFPGYVALFVVVLIIFAIGCRAFKQQKVDHYRKACYATKA
ncbi:hypothetical protein vseg_005511 [Gypsophila vaccaria]